MPPSPPCGTPGPIQPKWPSGGARGFTLTTHSKDLRPGGHWTYTMHGPDGIDYENKTIYLRGRGACRGSSTITAARRSPAAVSRDRHVCRSRRPDAHGHDDGVCRRPRPPRKPASSSRRPAAIRPGIGWPSTSKRIVRQRSVRHQSHFDAPLEVMFEMWTEPGTLFRSGSRRQGSPWVPPRGDQARRHCVVLHDGWRRHHDVWPRRIPARSNARLHRLHAAVLRRAGKPLASSHGSRLARDDADDRQADRRRARTARRVTVTWEPYGAATPEELAVFVQAAPA